MGDGRGELDGDESRGKSAARGTTRATTEGDGEAVQAKLKLWAVDGGPFPPLAVTRSS